MSKLDVLTPRERQIFDMTVSGMRQKVIARALDVCVGTVKSHRDNLVKKLGIGSTAEMVALSLKASLDRADDHALVAAALCARVARWEPFDGDPTRVTGEVCAVGLRYCTSLDDHGVPILTNLLRDALRIAMPAPKAVAA